MPKVQVSIVTYNSARHLGACLEGLARQSFSDFDIFLLDNASEDSTAGIIKESGPMLKSVHYSKTNLGFCAGHNRLIDASDSEYVLVLNPDVVLDSRFLEILVREMDEDPSAGAATGKLYRWDGVGNASDALPAVSGQMELDSTGIFFTPNQRHFDRGSGETDRGQYDTKEYVFGASGAAALYRRKMLDHVRTEREIFDRSFFAYREDADLAWRAQWMGWRCLYVPGAAGFHERKVLPSNRASVSPPVNMHSFKNRFLLRIKNMDAGTYARHFIPITTRDILAIGYVILHEWTSLPGFVLLFKALPKAARARRFLKSRRRVPPREVRAWFAGQKSIPL